jgi:hypothetical protein
MASVSLYVDGFLRATLTQPPFNFPLNALQFASGNHTLTAKAVDNSGNQAEASIVISSDHVPPAISITTPASGAMVSGIINVLVEASDSISGVASVTLYVDNQPHSTLNQPPFNFTVDTSALVPGSHPLTARALDRVGNQGEAGITITVVEPVSIEITSPAYGATINKSTAIVQGRVYNQMGEIGVVVNGVLAEVQGGEFAVIVPLQPGQNIITATATRPDGIQGQAQITINTENQEESVRLTVTPTSGILDQTGILNVTFEAAAYLVNPVSGYSWDFNGDGVTEITGLDSKVIAQYQYPGLYFPKVAVTDTQGNVYTETTLIHVLSREEIDALLRAKWEGMKGAMANKDVEKALSYFVDNSKEMFRYNFELMKDLLPTIVQEMGEIQIVKVVGRVAEYQMIAVQDGMESSFCIKFVKDEEGIWRIHFF